MTPGSNPRIGGYYLVGALLTSLIAFLTWPIGVIVLWPALCLLTTTAAYLGIGPRIFGKREGRLPFPVKVIMAPVLTGHRASLAHYSRLSDTWNPVTTAVWIGRKLTDEEALGAIGKGVTSVLDMTAESDEALPFLSLRYLNLPILDLTAPSQVDLDAAVRFITERAREGIVYVHCKVGYSRSAGAVGAYLLSKGDARNMEDVVEILTRIRRGIVIRPEIRAALRDYAAGLHGTAP